MAAMTAPDEIIDDVFTVDTDDPEVSLFPE